MLTKIGKTKQDVIEAANYLKMGELVAFPTETVYGLGGNALDSEASKKIYAVKGRPSDNPLIVHLSTWDEIHSIARPTPAAKKLYEAFCPGPITMILPKLPVVPDETTGGRNTVAVRFPSHPVARDLIALAGVPVAAPSANLSKHVSPTSAEHVYQDLGGRIPMILDGGECDVGIESTIVDLTGENPVVLRPGDITAEEIKRVLGEADYYKGEIKEALAPGMMIKHYSPSVPCYLADEKSLKTALENLTEKGINAVVIATDDTLVTLGNCPAISLGSTPREAQHRIYGALRDSERYQAAIIEDLSDKKEYFAAMDRIKKATGGNKL
ncbi:MAG TPA: threonylcarbamoyl-AMP synthase [Clostridiales bacterium]|nr:threonylcarbamoyl-AMP synthase [Clostridiales bacterium]